VKKCKVAGSWIWRPQSAPNQPASWPSFKKQLQDHLGLTWVGPLLFVGPNPLSAHPGALLGRKICDNAFGIYA